MRLISVQLMLTDPTGKPLELEDEYLENPVILSLTDYEDTTKNRQQPFSLTQGMKELVWNIPPLASTSSSLTLKVKYGWLDSVKWCVCVCVCVSVSECE